MFPKAKPWKTLRYEGNKVNCFLRDQSSSDISGNSLNLAVTAVVGQHSRVTVHCYPAMFPAQRFGRETVSLLDVM